MLFHVLNWVWCMSETLATNSTHNCYPVNWQVVMFTTVDHSYNVTCTFWTMNYHVRALQKLVWRPCSQVGVCFHQSSFQCNACERIFLFLLIYIGLDWITQADIANMLSWIWYFIIVILAISPHIPLLSVWPLLSVSTFTRIYLMLL